MREHCKRLRGMRARPGHLDAVRPRVPRELVRDAKSLAAKRGTTLTALVIDAVQRAVRPERATSDGLEPDLERDWAWFEVHRDELTRRYADQYIAVVGQQVVDHDEAFGPLAERMATRVGRRPVLMPRCVPGAGRVVDLPSPRTVRS